MTQQIIIVGRGHSGTRIPAQTVAEADVFIGEVNMSYDHMPPDQMYYAVRMFGDRVQQTNGYAWDFSETQNGIPPEFITAVHNYLNEFTGCLLYSWKLPEAILGLPWLVQMFPDAYYIHWIRDGRDNIAGPHNTDNLEWVNIPYPLSANPLENRAVSWLYQETIVDITPKPKRWIDIRYEDFIMRQGEEVTRLEEFLGLELPMIPVYRGRIGTHTLCDLSSVMPIIEPMLEKRGYL